VRQIFVERILFGAIFAVPRREFACNNREHYHAIASALFSGAVAAPPLFESKDFA
jgi:hypothetical protein